MDSTYQICDANKQHPHSAGCTIVSKNYFAYAKTLADSFVASNPDCDFYILVVDRATERSRFAHRGAHILFLEDLEIRDWLVIAFKFDILELNTNVKPTLLRYLLDRGYPRVYYLDPDIYCYQSIAILDDALNCGSILLTPHALSPLPQSDNLKPVDRSFLTSGVFNLGFIGVKNTSEGSRFLSWWENHCLVEGFSEPTIGLFVDQRWIDLVPCYFGDVVILKHVGCNVAYWNIHERFLEARGESKYLVRGPGADGDLVFYHFSGIDPLAIHSISKYQNRFTLDKRPDLLPIFERYARNLLENGHQSYKAEAYSFDAFSNGDQISLLMRRYLAKIKELSADKDPFSAGSKTHSFAKRHRLISYRGAKKAGAFNSSTIDEASNLRLMAFGCILRLLQFVLGADRFEILNKLMRYYGVPSNQVRILFRDR